MSVSELSGSVEEYQAARASASAETRAILVARKQQDVDKAEAQALIDLVKQSVDGVGQRINVYA